MKEDNQQSGFPVQTTPVGTSLRLTGAIPLSEEYQSLVPDVGWDPYSAGTRPSVAISGKSLVTQYAHLPEDLIPYRGGTLQGLAIGCFYLLLNQAWPVFPSTCVSAPSTLVRVVKGATLLRPGDATIFPLIVHWRTWKEAVVPVLQDERWQLEVPVNNLRVLQGRFSEFVTLLESALQVSYKAAGFLPQDF